MLGTPATFLAMAGTAFLLASYAPTALQARSSLSVPEVPQAVSPSGKGDRLDRARPVAVERAAVTVVEIVGVTQATVILRDRSGSILYRSDPLTNTTLIAKNADLPVVTLKDAPAAPQSPTAQDPSSRTPAHGPGERKPRTVGCESALSPLARGAGTDVARCLAQAPAPSAS